MNQVDLRGGTDLTSDRDFTIISHSWSGWPSIIRVCPFGSMTSFLIFVSLQTDNGPCRRGACVCKVLIRSVLIGCVREKQGKRVSQKKKLNTYTILMCMILFLFHWLQIRFGHISQWIKLNDLVWLPPSLVCSASRKDMALFSLAAVEETVEQSELCRQD